MKGLSLVQAEQLKQIGEYLLQVREKQSISLERVAKDTFIPLRLLVALEAGESDRLPEPVYIKGFIRRYADALGLDGTEIADAFEIDSPLAKPLVDAANAEPALQHSISPTTSPADLRSTQSQPSLSSRQSKPSTLIYALSGIAALGVVSAIVYGAMRSSQSSISQPPAAQTDPKVTQSNTDSSPASDSSSAAKPQGESSSTKPETGRAPEPPISATASQAAGDAPVQVDISLTDRSWMEVVADGKVKFEGILSKGEQRTWTAQNSLQIRAGNAGAVVASYNQGQSKPLGKLGDVVDASFSREDEKLRSGTP